MTKTEKYNLALRQIDALLDETGNALSNLSNASALLRGVYPVLSLSASIFLTVKNLS